MLAEASRRSTICLPKGGSVASAVLYHAQKYRKPGRPVQNAFVESFHGKLRDECLNASWFGSSVPALEPGLGIRFVNVIRRQDGQLRTLTVVV